MQKEKAPLSEGSTLPGCSIYLPNQAYTIQCSVAGVDVKMTEWVIEHAQKEGSLLNEGSTLPGSTLPGCSIYQPQQSESSSERSTTAVG